MSAISTNQRLEDALGGFISFTGFLILITVILTGTGTIDIESIFQSEIIVGVVVFISMLDIFCGVLLFLRERNWKGLFTPKKDKANKDID